MDNQLSDEFIVDHQYPWSDWMLFALYIFSILLALTSNSIILLVFYRKKKTKSATYILMSNMAISDLLSAMFILLQWYFCSIIFFHDKQSLSVKDQLYSSNSDLRFNDTQPINQTTFIPSSNSESIISSALELTTTIGTLAMDTELPFDLPTISDLRPNQDALLATNNNSQADHSQPTVSSIIVETVSQISNCGQRTCALIETLQMSTYYASTLTMAGIAYNRYILINRPLISPKKLNTTFLLMMIWFTSFSIAYLASISSLRIFVFFTRYRLINCRIILGTKDSWYLRKWRALILMVIQYLFPLCAILFLYVKIIKELKKCGSLARTDKHQSSTSSNTMSIDQYLMNRRYTNPAFEYGTIKRNSTSEIFKISMERRPEINNNIENFIGDDDILRMKNESTFEQPKEVNQPPKLPTYFQRINLANLPLVARQFQKTNKDLHRANFAKQRTNSVKERLNNQLTRMMNKKLIAGRLMNQRQSSTESQTNSTTSNQNRSQLVLAKLSILDDELNRTKRRLTKMMIVVVCLFALAWFPVHAMHFKQFVIDTHEDSNYCDSSFIYLFFYWVAFSTFWFNPIVYMYFSKEIRKDVICILKTPFNNSFKIKNLFKR